MSKLQLRKLIRPLIFILFGIFIAAGGVIVVWSVQSLKSRAIKEVCRYEPLMTKIVLPAEILRSGQIKYSKKYSVLLVAAEEENQLSVWSFQGGRLARLLSVAKEVGSQAHLYLDGQDNFYFEANRPYAFHRSADGGQTWQAISHGDQALLWSMADAGGGQLYATAWLVNKPLLYRSLDQGLTWQTWLDFNQFLPEAARRENDEYPFNRLRHLHDVAVYRDKILVGTGDVARWTLLSEDNGASWQAVWNEGFTAHTFGPAEGQLILGGDRADRYGLAFYDFNKIDQAENIWDQSRVGWSAYVYSLLVQAGRYYAGVHNENGNGLNYGVLMSCDGRDWSPLLEFSQEAGAPDTSVYLAESELPGFFLSLNGELYLVSKK